MATSLQQLKMMQLYEDIAGLSGEAPNCEEVYKLVHQHSNVDIRRDISQGGAQCHTAAITTAELSQLRVGR